MKWDDSHQIPIQLSCLVCEYLRMIVDCLRLNPVVTPIATAVQDVVSLLEQIHTTINNMHLQIWKMFLFFFPFFFFFCIFVSKDHLKQFAEKARRHLHCYTSEINSPSRPVSNLIHRHLNHLPLAENITVVHYFDDIMLIGPSKQETTTALDLLVRYLCVRGYKINLTKI